LEPDAPFTVFCSGKPNQYWPDAHQPADGCVRNIGGRKGSEVVCLPMGILQAGITFEARHAVRFQVFNPLTGLVYSNLAVTAGKRVTLPQRPRALILKRHTYA